MIASLETDSNLMRGSLNQAPYECQICFPLWNCGLHLLLVMAGCFDQFPFGPAHSAVFAAPSTRHSNIKANGPIT
jgi:hypothetical protein